MTNTSRHTPWPVVAGMLLVDSDGRVLLQHRDANAPSSPNKWGTPGGHVEAGETSLEAVRREVFEETGLRLTGEISLFRHFYISQGLDGSFEYQDGTEVPRHSGLAQIVREVSIFCGPTQAREEHLVLGEGEALAFVTPDEALRLDLATSTSYVLPLFLRSADYRRMATPIQQEA